MYDCQFCDGTGKVDENGDAVYPEREQWEYDYLRELQCSTCAATEKADRRPYPWQGSSWPMPVGTPCDDIWHEEA